MLCNMATTAGETTLLDDHDAYMQWTFHGNGVQSAEAPDGSLYVLTRHPQSREKYHVTKGDDLFHRDRHPHSHIDVATGYIAAQRAAEDHAYDSFSHWKPTLNHPTGQRRGVRA